MHDALQIIALRRVEGNLSHRELLSIARKIPESRKVSKKGSKKTMTKSSKGDKEEDEEE